MVLYISSIFINRSPCYRWKWIPLSRNEKSFSISAWLRQVFLFKLRDLGFSNSFSKLEQIEALLERFTNSKRSFFNVERKVSRWYILSFFSFFNCRRVNELARLKFKLRKSSCWLNPVFPFQTCP